MTHDSTEADPPTDITVARAVELRQDAEVSIERALDSFTRTTGLRVTDVRLTVVQRFGQPDTYDVGLRIEL